MVHDSIRQVHDASWDAATHWLQPWCISITMVCFPDEYWTATEFHQRTEVSMNWKFGASFCFIYHQRTIRQAWHPRVEQLAVAIKKYHTGFVTHKFDYKHLQTSVFLLLSGVPFPINASSLSTSFIQVNHHCEASIPIPPIIVDHE